MKEKTTHGNKFRHGEVNSQCNSCIVGLRESVCGFYSTSLDAIPVDVDWHLPYHVYHFILMSMFFCNLLRAWRPMKELRVILPHILKILGQAVIEFYKVRGNLYTRRATLWSQYLRVRPMASCEMEGNFFTILQCWPARSNHISSIKLNSFLNIQGGIDQSQ